MININGLYKFRDFFEKHTDKYVLIGGSACSIIFDEIGEDFRTTKDLDIVLIVENISNDFGVAFWEFIKMANYKSIETGKSQKQFYRFKKPENKEFPEQIELFTRKPEINLLPETHLTPVHISDEVSSLSAILLNNDYYTFLLSGRRITDGFSVLDEKYLIPFKAKAWCELLERKRNGEEGHSKNIKKHYKDVNKLLMLLPEKERVVLTGQVKVDMEIFLTGISEGIFTSEDIDNTLLCQRLRKIYL